jgi:hypothetical protein
MKQMCTNRTAQVTPNDDSVFREAFIWELGARFHICLISCIAILTKLTQQHFTLGCGPVLPRAGLVKLWTGPTKDWTGQQDFNLQVSLFSELTQQVYQTQDATRRTSSF